MVCLTDFISSYSPVYESGFFHGSITNQTYHVFQGHHKQKVKTPQRILSHHGTNAQSRPAFDPIRGRWDCIRMYLPMLGGLITFYPFGVLFSGLNVTFLINLRWLADTFIGQIFTTPIPNGVQSNTAWPHNRASGFNPMRVLGDVRVVNPQIPKGSNMSSPDTHVGVRSAKREKPRRGFNTIPVLVNIHDHHPGSPLIFCKGFAIFGSYR